MDKSISNDFDSLEVQKETFVASINHDLKNPTIAQIRALELFLKGNFGQITNTQREIIEMVLDSCKYMNAMLCSLLTTYRSDKGNIKLDNEKVSISELACECIGELIYLAKDKDINIKFYNQANKDYVYGDIIQLKRVIMNLLTNGIKYSYKNTEMRVSVFNDNNNTCFEFENKSPFLNPEKQEKLFARYVTFSQANKALGIGLGLYASKKIVEAHEGEIYVKSFVDNRNIFGFKIPNDESLKFKNRTVTF